MSWFASLKTFFGRVTFRQSNRVGPSWEERLNADPDYQEDIPEFKKEMKVQSKRGSSGSKRKKDSKNMKCPGKIPIIEEECRTVDGEKSDPEGMKGSISDDSQNRVESPSENISIATRDKFNEDKKDQSQIQRSVPEVELREGSESEQSKSNNGKYAVSKVSSKSSPNKTFTQDPEEMIESIKDDEDDEFSHSRSEPRAGNSFKELHTYKCADGKNTPTVLRGRRQMSNKSSYKEKFWDTLAEENCGGESSIYADDEVEKSWTGDPNLPKNGNNSSTADWTDSWVENTILGGSPIDSDSYSKSDADFEDSDISQISFMRFDGLEQETSDMEQGLLDPLAIEEKDDRGKRSKETLVHPPEPESTNLAVSEAKIERKKGIARRCLRWVSKKIRPKKSAAPDLAVKAKLPSSPSHKENVKDVCSCRIPQKGKNPEPSTNGLPEMAENIELSTPDLPEMAKDTEPSKPGLPVMTNTQLSSPCQSEVKEEKLFNPSSPEMASNRDLSSNPYNPEVPSSSCLSDMAKKQEPCIPCQPRTVELEKISGSSCKAEKVKIETPICSRDTEKSQGQGSTGPYVPDLELGQQPTSPCNSLFGEVTLRRRKAQAGSQIWIRYGED